MPLHWAIARKAVSGLGYDQGAMRRSVSTGFLTTIMPLHGIAGHRGARTT
jgi:hypothetical protein